MWAGKPGGVRPSTLENQRYQAPAESAGRGSFVLRKTEYSTHDIARGLVAPIWAIANAQTCVDTITQRRSPSRAGARRHRAGVSARASARATQMASRLSTAWAPPPI